MIWIILILGGVLGFMAVLGRNKRANSDRSKFSRGRRFDR